MINKYLFAAFALVWFIFMCYAWNLSRRQARLKKDLDELESRLPQDSGKR